MTVDLYPSTKLVKLSKFPCSIGQDYLALAAGCGGRQHWQAWKTCSVTSLVGPLEAHKVGQPWGALEGNFVLLDGQASSLDAL